MDTKSAKPLLEYPKLRNLEFFPVREGENQSVGLRDPLGISKEILFLPPNVFYLIQFLDGQHTKDQIAGQYLKRFGEILLPNWVDKFVAELDEKLFLENDRFISAQEAQAKAYRTERIRPAVYAGKSYEADPEKLKRQIQDFFQSKEGPGTAPSENAGKRIKAIVAPHVELAMAGPIYAWAYKELRDADTPDVFVILGTAHGMIDTLFACTDKDFDTPLGSIPSDREFFSLFKNRGGEIFFGQELAHRTDHAIEFQTLFLRYVLGDKKAFTIIPILCSFSHLHFGHPELVAQRERIAQFLTAFKETMDAYQKDVCFIVSGDLAHIGMRYGDGRPPTDFQFSKTMQADLAMLKFAEQGNAQGLLQFIQREGDARRIGMFPALYTMLNLLAPATGQVLRYDRATVDQYNSTVTYCAMAYY